jgi:glycine cleavage system H protein
MAQTEGLKFSKSHEWVKIEGEQATVGISQHAADELGDIALALLPQVGRTLAVGESFGEIESLKAVSELYAPIGGTVTATNETLINAPEYVNHDPYGAGWLIKLQVTDSGPLDSLMDAEAYHAFAEEA